MKLSITKETLRVLSTDDLGNINGGLAIGSSALEARPPQIASSVNNVVEGHRANVQQTHQASSAWLGR